MILYNEKKKLGNFIDLNTENFLVTYFKLTYLNYKGPNKNLHHAVS